MAYTAGDTILDDEYNTFATGNAAGTGDNNVANINTIWGTGTADKGYGQNTTLTAVSAGQTITATQWATMFTRFTSIANHQGTSVTAITNPVAGDTIDVKTNFSTNLSTLFSNRNNAAASGTDITTNGTTTTTSSWDVSAVVTQTFTFANSSSARYFFNAGGMIRMSYSRTGGTSSDKNTEWTDLLNQAGTIVFSGAAASKTIAGVAYTGTTKIGGSGTPTTLATGVGFYDLAPGAAATEIFKQFADSSPYTANYIQITVALDATSSILTVVTSLIDDATDTIAPDGSGSGNALDVVDGTLTATHVIRPPSETYISNSWGTPAMNSVSWVLTS